MCEMTKHLDSFARHCKIAFLSANEDLSDLSDPSDLNYSNYSNQIRIFTFIQIRIRFELTLFKSDPN